MTHEIDRAGVPGRGPTDCRTAAERQPIVAIGRVISPLPWSVSFDETGGYDCMTGAWTVRASDRHHVCDIDQGSFAQKRCDYAYRSIEAEANARFIVTACNAHHPLVEALKLARRETTSIAVAEKIDAALALVEAGRRTERDSQTGDPGAADQKATHGR